MKDTRIFFEKSYYVLQGILKSKKFQEKLNKYIAEMEKAGYPIPKNGFPTVAKYNEWAEKVSKANIYQYSFIDVILEDFNVRDNAEQIRKGIVWNVFLGKNTPPLNPTIGYSSKINKEENYIDLSIRFYAWSTKKEVEEVWGYINGLRAHLPAYKEDTKNKPWEEFERDFTVYELFLKVKEDIKKGIIKNKQDKSRSPYMQINYYPEFADLKKRHGDKLEDQISPIVSRCNKIFKNLNII
ncbi:hypothetical protein A3A70_02915 [candidate division WWE3 bacterium RIFCSPLOWO2_01_FULL_42_11]|uniref:Uncharacterized protein n=2 Tax=Bacteria candidate phyla TaxID=1783234 RepID=A0A1F5ZTL2_9BACT|nr:MAG: hypothetical protein A3A70_02915 [candidate division WWE3 bacterium RIFCSPLOWO2_01_FULL_42_11]OGG15462.1 MAG: hypothetical protein A2875_04220 [Candidatus Gottesmanbacteria bacterium RIFCSPHIGHO2_01_FULL_46_14]